MVQAKSLIWVSNAQTWECPKPATMKWTRDGGMDPFQFVAPPRGHAAIRPYRPHQPSPPHRPLDFNIEESAPGSQPAAQPPINVPRHTMDQVVEEARRAHQLIGPSNGVMARYGVRVLPPGTIATDGTTPTAGRADTAAKEEARAADAAAKGETTTAKARV